MTRRTQFLKFQMLDVRTGTRTFHMSAANTRTFHIPPIIIIFMRVVPRVGYKGPRGDPRRGYPWGIRNPRGGDTLGTTKSCEHQNFQFGHMKCPSDIGHASSPPPPWILEIFIAFTPKKF